MANFLRQLSTLGGNLMFKEEMAGIWIGDVGLAWTLRLYKGYVHELKVSQL